MGAQVSSSPHISQDAHVRNTVRVTAGDLLRKEIEAGSSMLGLAKLLAGSTDETNASVRSWYYVVRRARDGAEPEKEKVKRIEDVFDKRLEPPRREHRLDRLEAVEKATAENRRAIRAMVRRLDALEAAEGIQEPGSDPQSKAEPGGRE